MFENIIGYGKHLENFKHLITTQTFPSVTLLSGTRKSGKQSIAFEIARGLLCDETAVWGCTCSQCRQCYKLAHQNFVIMGGISDTYEIQNTQELLLRCKTPREKRMFERAIAKLLRHYDQRVWEHTDVLKRGLKSAVTALQELLVQYNETKEVWNKEKQISDLVLAAEKLYDTVPDQPFPIQCVKNVFVWAAITTSTKARVIIMNNIEKMLPQSANFLLKTLEEPPNNCYFILLTEKPQSVLETIRSRASHISLPQRSVKEQHEVLYRILKIDTIPSHFTSSNILYEYFHTHYSQVSQDTKDKTLEARIQTQAEEFFHGIINQYEFRPSFCDLPSKSKLRKQALIFISFLSDLVRSLIHNSTIPSYIVHKMWLECERGRYDIQNLHINQGSILEMLYYNLDAHYAKYKISQ